MREWHLITSEYPPQLGGVSDYTCGVARGLASEGDGVHVWCPPADSATAACAGITVHRELGRFTSADLRRVGEELDRFSRPRQLLVQWVPHGYGFRSMNIGFCRWLRERARRGDRVDLMVHEPFLSFGEGSWRQNVPALVHRLMVTTLLRAASRVWVSIPEWEKRLRPYTFGRDVPFEWLPIPSNIPVVEDAAGVQAVRQRYAPDGRLLVGHFGTYGQTVTLVLDPILSALPDTGFAGRVLLMGAHSDNYRDLVLKREPRLASFVQATGALAPEDLSRHLGACDLLMQPYLDGVSTRRTSFMAGLSHGKPIVTTAGHLTEPFWGDSGAAVIVPGGDARAFVESLDRLCSDEGSRKRMGKAAKKLYDERFDFSHVIARLRQVEDRETACAF